MKTIVFIVSLGHSGSTLIGNLVGSHKSALHLGEVVAPMEQKKPIKCRMCVGKKCPIWDTPSVKKALNKSFNIFSYSINIKYLPWSLALPIIRLRYGGILYDEVFALHDVSHLIDSSKDIEWYRFNSKRHRYKFLFVRRPVESYFAAVKRAKGWPVQNLIPKISLQLQKINHFYKHLAEDKKYVVDYQKLCFNTENVMRGIYDFIDLEYSDQFLQIDDLEFHLIGGNASHILQNKIELIESMEKTQNLQFPNHIKSFYKEKNGIFFDDRWKNDLSEDEKMLIHQKLPNPFVF